MNKVKFVVFTLILLSLVGVMFAQNANVIFNATTNATYLLLNQEYPGGAYPRGTTAAGRWVVQFYKSTDGVINPLDANGQPTGDDVALNNTGNNQLASIAATPPTVYTFTVGLAVVFPPTATEINGLIGDKVYGRIFNSNNIATATKSLVFNNMYTVTPTLNQTVNIQTTLGGWSAWVAHVVEPEDFELAITANYPGAEILYSADNTVYAPTGETADHTFAAGDAAAGWYKMGDLAGVVWTNNPYHFENTADAAFRFLGTKTPGFAINPLPADGATIEWPWDAPATGDVVLSWDPVVGVTGYNVYWNGAEIPVPVEDPTWTAEGLAEGEYTWKVVPFITDPVKGTVNLEPVRAKINDRSASVKGTPNPADAPVWGFEIVRLPKPPIDPENPPAGVVVVPGAPITTMPGNDTGMPAVTYAISAVGTWNVVVERPAGFGYPWFAFLNVIGGDSYESGEIHVDTYTFEDVLFPGGKADAELILDDNNDITLPVELSSFNAVLTAQYFVKLTWISQSETNLNGYRVYRSENTELVNATMITPIIISATNTSSTQVYSIEDREVAFGNTYWYWLESVENDGSSAFHGPTSVFVEGEVPPVLPQATTMRSAYPNPFKAASTTTIEVAVKEGESGSLTIYNVLGQVVKTYSLNQGIHNLKWNGKDNKGNICSSGIYFYKLSTPTMNQTKKMVIVK